MKTNLYIMRLVSCICVLTLCASCVLEVSPEPSAESPHTTDALTVFFTGNGLGELKPCGCSGGQLGGLDRRAAVFNRVPGDKRLIIDTGSLVKSDSEQDLIKFNIILQALKLLDYDLVSLNEKDIEIGKNVGLLDGTGPVFNIISPQHSSEMIVPAKFTKSLLLRNETVVVTIAAFDAKSAPIEQIDRLFGSGSNVNSAGVNSDSNLNILILSHCDDAIIDSIAKRIPLVDCIVCPSESDEPMLVGEANKRPLVFSVGRFGRYISGLQIKEAPGGKAKPILSFFTVPLEEDLEQEASLVQLYKDYQQLVRERNLLEKHPRFTLPDGLEYIGSESCKVCHEYEYEKWSSNIHAHAYATLERAGSQFDPECVICHVVGMEYESGFVSEQKTGHLKNVGCENCHGPGSEHIMTAGQTELTEPKSACFDCHTPEHSGDYAGNESSFQKKIVHWMEPKPRAPVK
ncbi:MAG TPA: cytochrome c family protein [Sedimentisphaerales bacterium]|nr:cytochrome c family protein [Sedimentisphaerales bacterium]